MPKTAKSGKKTTKVEKKMKNSKPEKVSKKTKPEKMKKTTKMVKQAKATRPVKVDKKVKSAPAKSTGLNLGLSVVTPISGSKIESKGTHYVVDGTVIPRTLVVAIVGSTIYYRATINLGQLSNVVDVKGNVCYVNSDGDKIVVLDTSLLSLSSKFTATSEEEAADEDLEMEDDEFDLGDDDGDDDDGDDDEDGDDDSDDDDGDDDSDDDGDDDSDDDGDDDSDGDGDDDEFEF
jgi:hypothetical protein